MRTRSSRLCRGHPSQLQVHCIDRISKMLRSVNGNGTRKTSPWLKLVVDGILGVVPELECRLGNFEPGDVVRLNFQMRRQVVKEPHLVAHIQMLDCLTDFLNRAHAGNFSRNFSDEKSEERIKEEIRNYETRLAWSVGVTDRRRRQCRGQWVKRPWRSRIPRVSIYFPDRATNVSAPISPFNGNPDFAKKLKWAELLTAWLQSLRRRAAAIGKFSIASARNSAMCFGRRFVRSVI